MIKLQLQKINSEKIYKHHTDEEINKIMEIAEKVKITTMKGRTFNTSIRSRIISDRIYGPGINDKDLKVNFNDITSFNDLPDNIKSLIIAYATFEDTNNNFSKKLEQEKITTEDLETLFKLINALKKMEKNEESYQCVLKVVEKSATIYTLKMYKYYGDVSAEIYLTKMNIEYNKRLQEKETKTIKKVVEEKIKDLKLNDLINQIKISINDKYLNNYNQMKITFVINADDSFPIIEELFKAIEDLKLVFPNLSFEIISKNNNKGQEKNDIIIHTKSRK